MKKITKLISKTDETQILFDENLQNMVLSSLEDDKAIELVIIDLKLKTSIANSMIIASGNSKRHITAMAEHIKEKIKTEGIIARTEGLGRCDWVLLDCKSVIVHLFRPETRDYYNLEKMWSVQIEPLTLQEKN